MGDSEKVSAAKAVYEKWSKTYESRAKIPNQNEMAVEQLEKMKRNLNEAGPKIKAYDEAVKGNLPVDKDLAKWMDAFLTKYR
jgi:hypothetical protein